MDKEKIIFLDIDGVLNHRSYYEREGWQDALAKKYGWPQSDIDSETVKILNRIISETGAKVVISSTWRLGHPPVKMQQLLELRGFVGTVIGATGTARQEWAVRGNEIMAWQIENADKLPNKYGRYFTNYVILDDDNDMLLWQQDYFINTTSKYGLTNELADRAIEILNEEIKLE